MRVLHFVATLSVHSAHKMGLKAAWINRADAVMGVSTYTADADWTFTTMAEFADAMEQAMGMGDVFE